VEWKQTFLKDKMTTCRKTQKAHRASKRETKIPKDRKQRMKDQKRDKSLEVRTDPCVLKKRLKGGPLAEEKITVRKEKRSVVVLTR